VLTEPQTLSIAVSMVAAVSVSVEVQLVSLALQLPSTVQSRPEDSLLLLLLHWPFRIRLCTFYLYGIKLS
jgi:hypothetical protein